MRIVNVDLDGVLADFNGGYKRLTGVDFDLNEDKDVRWWRFEGRKEGFYILLPPYSGAKNFVRDIKFSLPSDTHLRILTAIPSVTQFDTAYTEKVMWVAHNIDSYLSTCIAENSEAKQKWAREGDILIDDNPLNIQQWEDRGGIGILHTDFETSLTKLKTLL